MEIMNGDYYKAVKNLANRYCYKILFIDITEDRYEVLTDHDAGLRESKESSLSRISEYFSWFAHSPFCHENDRAKFIAFTDLRNLKDTFEKTNYASMSIIYRRRFSLSEHIYSNTALEIVPDISEDGHLTAFLFAKNITAEINKYHEIIEERNASDAFSGGERTVLVVEDNDMNREILAEILSEKYTVLQAENGAVGLELLQMHMQEISIVILDVQMPVMNGYEFLELVRKDSFLSSIPVIVATGSDSIEEERRCLKLGASDFVAKPYNPDIIMSRIAGIIRLKESAATMSILQTDERTGLYTLQAFYYYARLALDKNPDKSYMITVFDIDRFKSINDTYGEATGDRVLQQIASALKGSMASSDIYGRFGAARFLVMNESIPSEKIDEWINDLLKNVHSVCGIKGLTFKAGIYDNIDKSLSISAICDRAIIALNSCSQNHHNRYSMYDEVHAEKQHRLAVMEADMQEAYDTNQFVVYYQPKHEAATGKLAGAEALIRWIHPKYGFLSPGEFIPLFEQNGFISFADHYVMKRTCENLRSWIDEGLEPVPISVNSSRRDFERDDYADSVLAPLRKNGIDPSLIHLEVTESLFSDRIEEISLLLQVCRDAGFKVELDDFGAGYSSLTTLAALPLDIVKLDMSFMKNYKDEKKRKVLATCISLAQSLGMKTVAEGVEEEEQLRLLNHYGCDYIQGYYFSKPLSETEFRDYILKHSKSQE